MIESKLVLITGANTGIGKVTALELAKKGMTIILACRNEEKTRPVIEELKQISGNDRIHFIKVDLSSLASVKSCADEFILRFDRLDILINNAGMLSSENGDFNQTQDNYEITFQVNYLSHFLLTLLLLDLITKSGVPARIINVSSNAHEFCARGHGLDLTLTNQKSEENFFSLYAHSKLCNILFSNILAKKLQEKSIYVNSLHPGVVKTEIGRNLSQSKAWVVSYVFRVFLKFFTCTPEKGARTSVYVASSPDIEEKKLTGDYFVPPGKLSKSHAITQDEILQKKLWDFSMEACKSYLPASFSL